MQQRLRVERLLSAALECSIYLAPTDPGLTHAELFETGRRLGLEDGEMGDALPTVAEPFYGQRRIMLNPGRAVFLPDFHDVFQPDRRSLEAFEFLHSELKAVVRLRGVGRAALERTVVIERGVARGLKRLDLEVAVAICLLCGIIMEQAGVIQYSLGREGWPLPSQQRRQGSLRQHADQDALRVTVYPVVQDIISRRDDGRPLSAEPLEAFGEALQGLGYAPFRLWWAQNLAELKRSEVHEMPVSTCVMAASLVEGALTFVVRHAKSLGLPVLGSKDFERGAHHWKIDDLVKSAAHGGESAILDQAARLRAEGLIRTRQRIHAGRMLEDFPGGVPDLRPEEARDARHVADMVVRRVLEWLQRYPVA